MLEGYMVKNFVQCTKEQSTFCLNIQTVTFLSLFFTNLKKKQTQP